MKFLEKISAAKDWSQIEYKVRLRQEGDDAAADKKLQDDFEAALAALFNKFNKGKDPRPASSYPVLPGLK